MLIRICDICGEETGKEYYNVDIDAAAKCFDKNNTHYSKETNFAIFDNIFNFPLKKE